MLVGLSTAFLTFCTPCFLLVSAIHSWHMTTTVPTLNGYETSTTWGCTSNAPAAVRLGPVVAVK